MSCGPERCCSGQVEATLEHGIQSLHDGRAVHLGQVAQQGIAAVEELPLAVELEQLAEGWPLQQITQRIQQGGLGAQEVLQLGQKPAADSAGFERLFAALLDQAGQPLSQRVVERWGQDAVDVLTGAYRWPVDGRLEDLHCGGSTRPNSLLVISAGVVRVSTVKLRVSV